MSVSRDGEKVTINADTFRRLDDSRMRLNRIERDMRYLEDEIREQASGSQDGFLLALADRIRNMLC